MDGYAVRAIDLPGVLRVVGEAAAGRPTERLVGEGEAIAISTGGVVPAGADAVVPIERVSMRSGEVEIITAVVSGDNIRERGGDVRSGATVLHSGETLTPVKLAAAAASGIASVAAHRLPRVSIVVTGSELRPAGTELGPGQIYESNGVMLAAAISAAGATVEWHPATADTEEEHERSLARALESDVVVTSGGVSVGQHDLVRKVAARLGVEEVFWGVAMKPGKPLAFGVRGATLVFGLPGNPVSALVGYLLFVRPALLALQGHPRPEPAFVPGSLATDVRRRLDRDDFLRARLTWNESGASVAPITGQESHMIVQTTEAEVLVHIPRGEGVAVAGSRVAYLLL